MNDRKISLRRKVTIMIILMAVILTGVSSCVSYFTYKQTMNKYYIETGMNLIRTVASQLDGDKLGYYLDSLDQDQEYEETLEFLKGVLKNNELLYLYVVKPVPEGFALIFYVYDEDYVVDDSYSRGKILKSDKIFAKYEPIFDSSGKVAAYVGADISMDMAAQDRLHFLVLLLSLMGVITLIFIRIYVWLVRKAIVTPINQLSDATKDFIQSENMKIIDQTLNISSLGIRTNDEIQELAVSIQKMKEDIISYIINLTKVTAKQEYISAELDVAARIQTSMLPSIDSLPPDLSNFEVQAIMKPAKEVGGDFFDFFMVDDSHVGIVAADVSGKGIPAALFMVVTKTMMENFALQKLDPAHVFEEVNNRLIGINEAGLFVTAFMGILDISNGEFVFSNAGHNPPALLEKDSTFQYLKVTPGFVLAGAVGTKFSMNKIQMQQGERLFLYTDGVTEAENEIGIAFGEDQLITTLNQLQDKGLKDLLQGIENAIDEFVGNASQVDDITMLIFEYKGASKTGWINKSLEDK